MARWKLMTAHYLNLIEPTEYEYKETTRRGDQVRKRYSVPRMLDPLDPKAWNNSWGNSSDLEGEIVVALPGKGSPRDYEFTGDPTPDMIPIDDEAREISASFAQRWSFKPDGEASFSQSMVDRFESAMAEAQAKPAAIEVTGLDKLLETQAQLTSMFAQFLQATAPAATIRR